MTTKRPVNEAKRVTCPACGEEKPTWAFPAKQPDRKNKRPWLCHDCQYREYQQAELAEIPAHERLPHERALLVNDDSDAIAANYQSGWVVGQRGNCLLMMFDTPHHTGPNTMQFIAPVARRYVYTGPEVEPYIEARQAQLRALGMSEARTYGHK